MRIRSILLTLLLFLALASPAWALMENEFALSPQAGMVTMTGKPGGLFASDFGYGSGVAYGITDIFGVDADFIYSVHNELDEEETGRLILTQFFAGIGPRVNYNTQYVVPYLSLLGGATFMRYKARWEAGNDSFTDDNDAHAFGGAVAGGMDIFIHDGLTIGLAGRVGYFGSNLIYKHKDTDDGEGGNYAYIAGLFRFTLLF